MFELWSETKHEDSEIETKLRLRKAGCEGYYTVKTVAVINIDWLENVTF